MSWTIAPIGRGGDLLYSQAGTPSLDLRFAENKTLTDYVSGNNLVTFSRPVGANQSPGTYVDENGIIQLSSADTPRFDHDPTTGESLGLLVEEARTNIQTYSEDASTYSRYALNSVVLGSAISPDGQMTANELIPDATLNPHLVYTISSASVNLTISVYAKANTYRYLCIGGRGSNSASQSPVFDLQNGTVATVPGSVWTSTSITPAGNGWYRCAATATSGTGGAVIGVAGSATNHDGTFLADGVSSLYIWGVQLEQAGSFPTSYIPTAGSTVTRAADSVSITGANFSSWYNQSEGTYYAQASKVGTAGTSQQTILTTGGNTRYPEFSFRPANDATPGSGQVYGTNLSVKSTVALGSAKFTGAYKDGIGATSVINNTYQGANTNDPITTIRTSILIGNFVNSNYLNGHISRLTYWPERLADATLQAITAP